MPCGCGPQSCPDFDPDAEGLSDEDIARFGGDDITCPDCGAEVYHDSALCHECGFAMTADAPYRASPVRGVVIAMGGVIALLAFMFAFVF